MATTTNLVKGGLLRTVDTGTRAERATHGRIDRDKQDHVKITGNDTYRQMVMEADNDDDSVAAVGFVGVAKGVDMQVGVVPAASITAGVTVREYGGFGGWHRTRFILTAVAIAIVDDGSSGSYGAEQLYTFPYGDIHTLWGKMTLSAVVAGAGSILHTTDGIDIGVGESELAAAATSLSGDYENLINKDDITLAGTGALASAATIFEATGDVITGNDTAGDAGTAFLNVAVSSGGTGTEQGTGDGDTLTITGTIDLFWFNYGDY